MEGLKPCPFCGGKEVKTKFSGDDIKFACVECVTCGARTRSFQVQKEVLTDYAYARNQLSLNIMNDILDRIEILWNRRVDDGRTN